MSVSTGTTTWDFPQDTNIVHDKATQGQGTLADDPRPIGGRGLTQDQLVDAA